jgi:hypothetical protein
MFTRAELFGFDAFDRFDGEKCHATCVAPPLRESLENG